MDEIMAALIGGAIGFLASFLILRFNYNQLFAQTVSSNRIEWMNSIRENLSKFLANAEILREINKLQCSSCPANREKDDCEEYFKLKRDMFQARELVTTRLNLEKNLQKLMFAAIKSFDETSENFAAKKEYIEELARKILRFEWDSVKKEAKGKEK